MPRRKTSVSGKTNLVVVSKQLFHFLLQCWCLPQSLSGSPRWRFEHTEGTRGRGRKGEVGEGGELYKDETDSTFGHKKGTFLIFVLKEQEHFVLQNIWHKGKWQNLKYTRQSKLENHASCQVFVMFLLHLIIYFYVFICLYLCFICLQNTLWFTEWVLPKLSWSNHAMHSYSWFSFRVSQSLDCHLSPKTLKKHQKGDSSVGELKFGVVELSIINANVVKYFLLIFGQYTGQLFINLSAITSKYFFRISPVNYGCRC